jgi:hypothetical protein
LGRTAVGLPSPREVQSSFPPAPREIGHDRQRAVTALPMLPHCPPTRLRSAQQPSDSAQLPPSPAHQDGAAQPKGSPLHVTALTSTLHSHVIKTDCSLRKRIPQSQQRHSDDDNTAVDRGQTSMGRLGTEERRRWTGGGARGEETKRRGEKRKRRNEGASGREAGVMSWSWRGTSWRRRVWGWRATTRRTCRGAHRARRANGSGQCSCVVAGWV